MPLYYKNQGNWETVDSPYIKQNGEWIEPEEAYIKENGEWKLVFEEFAFTVVTEPLTQTSRNLVLNGKLTDFESFNVENTFFKDQELVESTTGDALAVDENRGLVATGGANDTVYIYNQNLSVIDGSEVSQTNEFGSPKVVPEPDSQINSLSFYENGQALAVGADDLYIFEEDFNQVARFSVDAADGSYFTDVEFREDGTLAAGTDGPNVYVFNKDADGNWQRNNKLNDPISGIVTSVAFRQSDGYIAVGSNQGQVVVYSDPTDTTTEVVTLEDFDSETAVAFSREDGRLAVSDFNEKINVYSSGFGTGGADPAPTPEASFNNTATDTFGEGGDVTWNGSGLLAHASVNGNLYVYQKDGTDYENIKTFEDADKPYQTAAWDGANNLLIGGTNENGSGRYHAFSTGVRMFFKWGEKGTGANNIQRVTGLRSLGSFETQITGLDTQTEYEFLAGGEASGGRRSISEEPESFETPTIEVATSIDNNQIGTTTAIIGGELDTFERPSGASIEESFVAAVQYKKQTRTTYVNEQEVGLISPEPNSSFTAFVEGLEAETKYDVRAKATYAGTVVFGDEIVVETRNVTASYETISPLEFGEAFDSSENGPDSITETVILEETSGTGQYTVTGVSIGGEDPTSFSADTSIVGEKVPQPQDATPREESFDVTLEPSSFGPKNAKLLVEHDAPSSSPAGQNPLVLQLNGTGERPTTLSTEGTNFETVNDGDEEVITVTVREIGGDYGAIITDILEATNQPNADASEWDLKENSSPLPTELQNGNNYQLDAGTNFQFDIGWNTDAGNEEQSFVVQVDYESGIGTNGGHPPRTLDIEITGTADGTVEVNLDPERNGDLIDETSETYNFGSEITKRTNREPDPNVTDEDVTVVRKFQLVGDPASAGSSGDPYEVQHMRIEGNNPGDVPGDFAILNAPSDATDGSSGTFVEIGKGDIVTFEVEFNPSSYQNNPIEAQLAIYAANADNSVEFENDTPYLLDLQGEGLQPGEIATENANDSSASEPYEVGTSIAGGNPLPNEGTLPITVTNISPDRDVKIRSDSIENAYNNDFRVESSIEGDLIGQSAKAISESTDAEVEIRPTVKRSNNQGADNNGYIDGETIGSANYKIFNDADFGPDPVNVEIEGTFQVTNVKFIDGSSTDRDDSTFDPTTEDPDIIIAAAPGSTSTRDLTVYIDKTNNTVSTNAVIEDPQTTPISLGPAGSDGTVSGVLNINGNKDPDNGEADFLTGTVFFSPENQDELGKTQDIIVKWDNQNESQPITVKGIAGSTINVSIDDGDSDNTVSATLSGTTASIDYGQVTENKTKLAQLVVEETSGNRSFDITSDLSFVNATSNYSLSKNDITSGTTLQGNETSPPKDEVTADILAKPTDGSAGGSGASTPNVTATVSFAHDARTAPETYLQPPVEVGLEMNVLNKAEVTLNDVNTEGTPINLSAEPGDTNTETVQIVENGGDNDANISGLAFTNDAEGVFDIKNNFTDVVTAGTSTNVDAPRFSPTSSTGSKPEFIVNGILEVTYTGPGAADNASAQIGIQGEVVRPPKADFSSGTNKPFVIQGDPTVGGEQRGSGTYFEENLALDGTVVQSQEYIVVEKNKKDPYNVTGVIANGPAGNPYENRTSGSGNLLAPSNNGGSIQIPADGQNIGTIDFAPSDSGFFDDSRIEVSHDAPREGDKANEGPDNSTIVLPVFAEVVGDPESATWSLAGKNYSDQSDFSEGDVNGLPENCQDIIVQAANLESTGNVLSLSIVNDPNSSDLVKSPGQRAKIKDDVSGFQNFRVIFQVDTSGLNFRIKLYEVRPGENTSTVAIQESDGDTPNGNELASVTVGDGNRV